MENKSETIRIGNNTLQSVNFLILIETILEGNVDKLSVKLTPDVKKYLLFLCKEKPSIFGIIENNIRQIILDDKIDTKDIPELINLVCFIYDIIQRKKNKPNIDIYEFVKIMLHLSFFVYIETNKVKNAQLLNDLLRIIDVSIDLIKMKPLISEKKCCFGCL